MWRDKGRGVSGACASRAPLFGAGQFSCTHAHARARSTHAPNPPTYLLTLLATTDGEADGAQQVAQAQAGQEAALGRLLGGWGRRRRRARRRRGLDAGRRRVRHDRCRARARHAHLWLCAHGLERAAAPGAAAAVRTGRCWRRRMRSRGGAAGRAGGGRAAAGQGAEGGGHGGRALWWGWRCACVAPHGVRERQAGKGEERGELVFDRARTPLGVRAPPPRTHTHTPATPPAPPGRP